MRQKNIFFIVGILFLVSTFSFVLAQPGSPNNPNVGTQATTVCCEQTNNGAFCQNVPASECKPNARQIPTSCESTSYCRGGTCYDSTEGTCLDNTPQLVCNANGGVWNQERPPQCQLGCCILGDQAAYVSLVRCKRLSAFLGLETNYDRSVTNEVACIEKVQQQERGACVYEFEFEKTCKFGTRAECNTQISGNATLQGGTFYGGKLCSAEELNTNCGPTTRTTCVDGKDEVYFVDSCGNPANIYDASKTENQEYWTNVKGKDQSCNSASGNILSSSCGNCDYLQGSICRSERLAGGSPTYGDFICADLNCANTQNGNSYKHGESWCVYKDAGGKGNADNTVGSRFYKHVCINGEEVLEQCEDFRAEECIEQKVNTFSQAACKVNRWQDCLGQNNKVDCENEDRRDCVWKQGVYLNGTWTYEQCVGHWKGEEDDPILRAQLIAQCIKGTCLPENKPGFNFWSDSESTNLCSAGNAVCVVKFEKGIFGNKECVENCECLGNEWQTQRANVCAMLGDCGPSKNWIGKQGYKSGWNVTISEVEE